MSDDIARGDIWLVRFDPSEGDEIRKIRPAVVMTAAAAGRMKLEIVVPVTGWKPSFAQYAWIVHLTPDTLNGLSKESAADAFQVRSVSVNRFQAKLGIVNADVLEEIAAAIAWCVDFRP